ncbi:MAG: hypothetical protein FWD69_19230 [Polyangiaceae bacterium]|nr:hypothetical protein [Polyangiaceae bacterium]
MDCILAGAMRLLDVLGVLLVLGASTAFVFGALALSRSSDVEALYVFVIGFVALRAGVQIVRPGADA